MTTIARMYYINGLLLLAHTQARARAHTPFSAQYLLRESASARMGDRAKCRYIAVGANDWRVHFASFATLCIAGDPFSR